MLSWFGQSGTTVRRRMSIVMHLNMFDRVCTAFEPFYYVTDTLKVVFINPHVAEYNPLGEKLGFYDQKAKCKK